MPLAPHRENAFLDLSAELSSYPTSRIAVLPCPYDGTSTYAKGADRGPAQLLAASPQLEPYDLELGRQPCAVGITVLPAAAVAADDPEAAVVAIEDAASKPLEDSKFLVGLGGEHTVSIGLTRALRRSRGPFHLLQIDAHHDLRDEYEGSHYNHACVMRRITEDDPRARLVAVGIRACSEEEVAYARARNVFTMPGQEIGHNPRWIAQVLEQLPDPVYVSVDLDGLDPAILPSTGTPVPGGLRWYETLDLLRRVGRERTVVGCDVVELKPDPVNHHAVFLAAQLVYKMMGYFVPSPNDP